MKKKGRKKKSVEQMIDSLAVITARGFARTAAKEDLKEYSTKVELKSEITNLRDDIDVMLARHIGTFRRDYDDLAMRVKKIEQVLFHRK